MTGSFGYWIFIGAAGIAVVIAIAVLFFVKKHNKAARPTDERDFQAVAFLLMEEPLTPPNLAENGKIIPYQTENPWPGRGESDLPWADAGGPFRVECEITYTSSDEEI